MNANLRPNEAARAGNECLFCQQFILTDRLIVGLRLIKLDPARRHLFRAAGLANRICIDKHMRSGVYQKSGFQKQRGPNRKTQER